MIRIENIISDFKEYTENKIDCSPIQKAYVLAAKSQAYPKILPNTHLQTALEVTKILTDLKLDIQSIVSGLLHGILLQGKISLDEIRDLMGEETADIIEGMHNILSVSDIPDEKERIAEKMRQMIFASSKDIRIIFVNLAARLVRMRQGNWLHGAKTKVVASETLQTYAPIAERLGLSHIKTELEDLSFSILHPKEFKQIRDFCKTHEEIHKSLLERLHHEISELLPTNRIEASIKLRIKHYYSIFLKAKRIGVDYDQLHDLLGIRILVGDVDECYKVLGLVNSFYRPVTETFKDYISFPKPNGYQSLHIDVYSKDGLGFDVQIRTREMDKVAERGIAAHWAYKEKSEIIPGKTENTSWLQDLSKSLNFANDPKESLEIFTRELYSDFVYVFTPKGKIVKLQFGACVIDFAYAIHTELGDTCVGGKINGRMVPIKTRLKHGDKVEILTSSKQKPSSDWLKVAITSKALSKIRSHLRKKEKQEAEKLGKEMFAEQMVKIGRKPRDVQKSAELKKFLNKSGYADINGYYSQLGFGKANINDLARLFEPSAGRSTINTLQRHRMALPFSKKREGVRIAGIENMMIRYANCCKPIRGDTIVGVVTRGQGVSIHMADCDNIRSQSINPERLVDVEWIKSSSEKLPVSIHMRFDNLIKTNLQIMKALAASKVVLLKNNLQLVDNTSHQDLTIKVDDFEQLDKILNRLNSIPSVRANRSFDAGL
ncbi:MAG: bifunctional (p)ppGpp synthetase/guanosine-3',5'-bis(diphosphate) 3'-pyrophosphohydrolase [Proteobacteria bacterium]|nr:bifunctional (p)ppGpp synthetase/guanosine-3',5'-bis(diphosphate) 3'-pyrophosphohydrolase [Pseudomonadota bacterium]